MAKMGRPPVPKRDYRGEFITVRLRAAEKRAIIAAARKAGAGHTDWARSVLLAAAGWEADREPRGGGSSR
jgi:hypothetical protein